MRISFGELAVAVIGVGTVLMIILTVLANRGPSRPESTGDGGQVEIIAESSLNFDADQWTSDEGDITFVYTDAGNLRHTLFVEGYEDEFGLEVTGDGDVDMGSINLRPGTYTLYCNIKGHREAGMQGTLVVTESAPTASG